MVGAWTVTTLVIGIAIFSFFIPWAEIGSSNGFTDASLTPINLATAIGAEYGPCGCPPWASLPQNPSQGAPFGAIQDVALKAIIPALVSVTLLAAAAWIFPLAFLLAFISMFRWKVMVVSGMFFVVSGALWIVGMAAEANHVNSVLAQWAGQAPGYVPPTVSVSFGSYLSVFSGVILTAGYLLARRDAVEWPLD